MNNITKVAMDTHKKFHKGAFRLAGSAEIHEFQIKNTYNEIKKMVKRIKRQAPGEVSFCYEAGVCGFDLKRKIESLDCKCVVIAPSMVPVTPGNRIKTDRRDALKLLMHFESGQLTEVYAPNLEQESARELTRCRQAAKDNLKRVCHQILKLLNRHGYIYSEGSNWTQKHLNWMKKLEFGNPLLRDVFDNYFTEMQHCQQRIRSLDRDLEKLAESEMFKDAVGLLKCFHGIKTLTAISIVSEIFEFGRFDNPGKLMGYLGLIPVEHSSGEKKRRGPIAKTGNKRVRRLLVEVGWHYRHPYNAKSKTLSTRREGQPQWAIDIADRAGQRLRKRYWYLVNRGKIPSVATVAIAREMAGFIWDMMHQYMIRNNIKKAA